MVGAAPEPHVPAARRSAHRSLPGICRRAVLALAMHEHTVYRTWAALCEAIHSSPAYSIKKSRMNGMSIKGYMLKLSHDSSGYQYLHLQDWLGDQISSSGSTVSFQACDAAFPQVFGFFTGYWAVDAKEETAMNGTWKKGPGTELFAALERASLFLATLAFYTCSMTHCFLMSCPHHATKSAGSEDVWQLNHIVCVLNCFKCKIPLAGAGPCAYHSRRPGRDHSRRARSQGEHRSARDGGAAVCFRQRPNQYTLASQPL